LALTLVIINLKLFHLFFCHVSLLNVPGCELRETEYLESKSFHRTMLDGASLSSFRKRMLTIMKKHYRNTTNQETEKSIKMGLLSSRSDEHVTCHQTSFSPLSPGNKFQIRQYLICVCRADICSWSRAKHSICNIYLRWKVFLSEDDEIQSKATIGGDGGWGNV